MGWWSENKPKNQSFKEWAENKYNWEDENNVHRVLDVALVHRTTAYLACERLSKKDGVKYVYCMVLLIRWDRTKYSSWNMLVKEMDETVGPYQYECPEKIFKLLSPPRKLRVMGYGFKWVKDWRKKVIDYHAKRKYINSINDGDIITFEKGVYINGRSINEFRAIDKLKMLFEDTKNRINICKLPAKYLLSHSFVKN